MSLKMTEYKINSLLELFNDRTGNELQLVLTLNKQDYTVRGYGTGLRTGEEVQHFVDLLNIKGLKAKSLQEHSFIVEVEPL